jgi:PBSX family phage terminase large subunit
VRDLCKEYENTVYYARYILGKWALAEGLIYPMYQKAIADPPQGSRPLDYCVSLDYGTQNAFAALLWEKHPDGVWYGTRLYYYSGRQTGVPKTDEEYASELDAWLADVLQAKAEVTHEDNPFLAGMQGEKLRVIIDPSAASFITLLRRRGKYHVVEADNAVLDGIRETASAMALGAIKVSPSCSEWLDEAQGYSWDPKLADKSEEAPLKEDDHAMDATRYFVKTMYIVKKWLNERR